jgi:hypothetical protein
MSNGEQNIKSNRKFWSRCAWRIGGGNNEGRNSVLTEIECNKERSVVAIYIVSNIFYWIFLPSVEPKFPICNLNSV